MGGDHMGNKQYSIGPITGLLKPKYRIISSILGEDFNPLHGLDVFIDLNTLVTSLSGASKFMNSLPFSENVEEDIISNLLLTLKHWKDFTRKWDNVRIFMFVNDFELAGMPEQEIVKSYLVPYMHKYQQDRYQQFVYYWNESIKRVEIVLKYVPNSYLIHTNRFDSYVLPNLLENYSETNRHRIIITGHALFTNYVLMPNTSVIYTRYIHTGMSQLSDPIMICQSISKIDDDVMNAFIKNRVFYNLLNAIIGDYDRGIMGLSQIGISAFATELIRAVEQRKIPEDPKSIEAVFPAINKNYHDYLKKSYPLIDITTHTGLIPQSMIEKVKGNMVDLYDIDGLRSYTIQGLNLLELL
jgi:hypothetical protein